MVVVPPDHLAREGLAELLLAGDSLALRATLENQVADDRIVLATDTAGRPLVGPPLDSATVAGGGTVVILSDALWQTRFGADPSIIGRTIRLDGYGHQSREVVGILPRGFRPWSPPSQNADVLIPLSRSGPRTVATDSTWYVNYVIARLAPGATVDRAAAEVRARTDRLVEEFPRMLGDGTRARAGASGLLESMVGEVTGTLLTMLAAVGLIVVLRRPPDVHGCT